MSGNPKRQQYLQRYAEPEARLLAQQPPLRHYDECLVIPAYREPATAVTRWQQLPSGGKLLLIVVLNHPAQADSAHANDELRGAIGEYPLAELQPGTGSLYNLSKHSDLLLIERENGLPPDEGVGLARKIGADAALAIHSAGQLASRWIHCSDADAILPADYFSRSAVTDAVCSALCHPFVHTDTGAVPALVMQLYELRLHYYVRGLQAALSPYAFHTLGSCISVDIEAYQKVRGFPRRAAAEDFYLLNKLAKVAPVLNSKGAPVQLEARASLRVPFGTGPAVARLSEASDPLAQALFYHPTSFAALGALLGAVADLYNAPDAFAQLSASLAPYPGAITVMEDLGAKDGLLHCQQHSSSPERFKRHFNDWFDGFRSLKFVHGMRAAGYSDMTLAQSQQQSQAPWPTATGPDTPPAALLKACQNLLK